jgi:S-adenosylmethionine decarboxylase
MAFWGKHCIATVRKCNPVSIRSPTVIKQFIDDLVDTVGMKKYGPCTIVHFGSGEAKGYTAVQLIETSAVVCHFCENSCDLHFDLFSCKDFDEANVRQEIQDKFSPESITTQILLR